MRWRLIFLLTVLVCTGGYAYAYVERDMMTLQISKVKCARWHNDELAPVSCENPKIKERAKKMIKNLHGDSLLSLDLAALTQNLKSISGINAVHARRRLPNLLEVTLIMHRPLAIWADGGLVDVMGKHYEGNSLEALPVFHGASKQQSEQIAEFYDFSRKTLYPEIISQLQLESDDTWKIVLQNGKWLYIGNDTPSQKIRRYVRYRKTLDKHFAIVKSVDLRYMRGFSVDGDLHNKKTEET